MSRARRWVRFSIRTTLVVILLVCIFAAFFAAFIGKHMVRQRIQRPIVERILLAGGNVGFNDQYGSKSNYWSKEYGSPKGGEWIRKIFGDDFYSTVHSIHLYEGQATESLLSDFPKLKDLRNVSMRESKLTKQHIAHLLGIQKLEHLEIKCDCVTVPQFGRLAQSKSLKSVTLWHASDQHLSELLKFHCLDFVQVIRSDVSDRGMESISQLKNLKELFITTIDAKQIPSSELSVLATLDSLETLYLNGISINSESVQALINLNSLRQLFICVPFDTDVTLVDKIIEQKPNCQIVCSIGSEDGTSATYYYPDPPPQQSTEQLEK